MDNPLYEVLAMYERIDDNEKDILEAIRQREIEKEEKMKREKAFAAYNATFQQTISDDLMLIPISFLVFKFDFFKKLLYNIYRK